MGGVGNEDIYIICMCTPIKFERPWLVAEWLKHLNANCKAAGSNHFLS